MSGSAMTRLLATCRVKCGTAVCSANPVERVASRPKIKLEKSICLTSFCTLALQRR